MKKIKESPQTVRFRLFISLCIIVALIILFLIVINNVVLESFYLYSKIKNVKLAYEKIDEMYVGQEEGRYDSEAIENELNKISVKNNFDILVIDNKNTIIYSTSKNLTTTVNKINEMKIVKGSNWLVSGVIYASYNSILLIPVLISINKIITKKEISKTAIIITLTTFILATSIFVSMLKIDVNIRNLEMPVSYVINTQLPKLKIAYGIVILTSILTTAISLIAGLMQNVKKQNNKKIILYLICISSIPISQIGFSALIQLLYPIFGYIGILQIILISIKERDKK